MTHTFDANDPLTEALSRAIEDTAARTEFYRRLLEAQVHVLATRSADGRLMPMACEGENGSLYVPFFSALPLLRAAIAPDQPHTALQFRELITLMPQYMLWLNPLSPNNKQFLPSESAFLAARGVASAVMDAGNEKIQLLMAHVAPEIHRQARQLLSSHLRAEEGLRSAWLIQTYRPDLDDPPRLLLGLYGENLPAELIAWATGELQKNIPGRPEVDALLLQADHAVSDYIQNEVDPIFSRGWMDKLFG